MSKINARSPFYISVTADNLTSCKLELFIYTGTQGSTSRPTTATYTLRSFAIDEVCVFEISEYAQQSMGHRIKLRVRCPELIGVFVVADFERLGTIRKLHACGLHGIS